MTVVENRTRASSLALPASALRRRNALVPLHRLPSEILAIILLESLDPQKAFDQMALRKLAQVAHRWWEIIKSEPQFWTYVVWPGDDVALGIRKAGTLPLQLVIRHSQNLRSKNPKENIGSLLRMHANRWLKISIESFPGHVPRLVTDAFERSAFSRLEVLHMEGIGYGVHLEIGHVERLREAWLSFIPCRGHDSKPINPAPLLTNLYLSLSRQASYPSACLNSFLRHCPNLQELTILDLSKDSDGDNARSQAPSLIPLPALRLLSIKDVSKGDNSTDIPILGLIRCPNLATFDIRYSLGDRWGVGRIDAAAAFRALWASSPLEPDALPMSSVVRNVGDSVYISVVLDTYQVEIRAQNRETDELSPMDLVLPAYDLDMEGFSREILPYLNSFNIPIGVTQSDQFDQGSGRWSDILDRFQNVTILQFCGTKESVQELIEALSQPSSLPGGGLRAPNLETLRLHDDSREVSWTMHAHQMAPHIAAMLRKRWELFKASGMLWPSKLWVTVDDYYTFNEDEGGLIKLE
ncbi:hypothetical protein M407DRAFT_23699 [Tulasnella calospora MUT 4182]|uniref:F-box domain-containing protein n=1 Tax=Tulasnella calospora MUT 4182 TaxID=1051891 RepID=A0A0C3M038_9AGAM|nr:hypothetical protein M407DRAFT_23699 [Tulasnella calospora MUT 4182]